MSLLVNLLLNFFIKHIQLVIAVLVIILCFYNMQFLMKPEVA